MKVLGTAPGKTKWSYYPRLMNNASRRLVNTHFVKDIGPNAVHEHIVGSMEVEALLNLCIWCEKDVSPARSQQK